jgi:hypothetical protein
VKDHVAAKVVAQKEAATSGDSIAPCDEFDVWDSHTFLHVMNQRYAAFESVGEYEKHI